MGMSIMMRVGGNWISGVDEVFKGNWYVVTGAVRLATLESRIGTGPVRDIHRKVDFMTPKIGFRVLVRWKFI